MKRYYWLKLKDDFFTQKAIKKLRKIAGGDTFTIIYLKMMLLAMKSEGKLYFEGIEESFYEEMSLVLDEEKDNVQLTVTYLINHKLMEVYENEYYLPESIQNTGSETKSAERVRKHREQLVKNGTKTLQCNTDVTTSNTSVTTCNTEKRREDKRREDIDKTILSDCVHHLNSKAGTSYKANSSYTSKLLKARISEGHTIDDIKKVIDIKSAEWKGTDMAKFLRPETLFGTKFESYLNQAPATKYDHKEELGRRFENVDEEPLWT